MNENTISVTAIASFVETESDAKQNRYIFAYTITIANTGKRTAQLLKRHWVLTNSNGKIEEVDGDGVIGMHPRISGGESFCYTSSALLETDVGTMQGYYTFRDDKGETFNTEIPRFTLSIPRTIH
ncbi:MAG: Co2+/Mg2+ efflux protein ApaG [Methylococcaceae bacterium]|jgi:ApaG protein|nr:Co2+/Mg2+ efflux protein ApaG [Methylococcales bacterium]MSR17186.1 Co2+/Mg2+ efflux protein ApaG [Methylococcaceae bacterium]